jgi:hypothetical protein
MIHHCIDAIIHQMTVIDIYDLPKLPLLVKSHRPRTEDTLVLTATGDVVTEAVFDLVPISSDIGSGECGLHFTSDSFAIDTLFDGFLFEHKLVGVGDGLPLATTTSDLGLVTLRLDGMTTAGRERRIGTGIMDGDDSPDDFAASFADDADITDHTWQHAT